MWIVPLIDSEDKLNIFGELQHLLDFDIGNDQAISQKVEELGIFWDPHYGGALSGGPETLDYKLILLDFVKDKIYRYVNKDYKGEDGFKLNPTLKYDKLYEEAFEDGYFDLMLSLMLSDTDNVRIVEESWGFLPITGSKYHLVSQWNRVYYSDSNCIRHNDASECLRKAAQAGHEESFFRRLETLGGVGTNKPGALVFAAIQGGNINILTYLFKLPNRMPRVRLFLFEAIRFGNFDVFKFIIEHFDYNLRREERPNRIESNEYIINNIILWNRFEFINYLLNRNNIREMLIRSGLTFAAYIGNREMFDLLYNRPEVNVAVINNILAQLFQDRPRYERILQGIPTAKRTLNSEILFKLLTGHPINPLTLRILVTQAVRGGVETVLDGVKVSVFDLIYKLHPGPEIDMYALGAAVMFGDQELFDRFYPISTPAGVNYAFLEIRDWNKFFGIMYSDRRITRQTRALVLALAVKDKRFEIFYQIYRDLGRIPQEIAAKTLIAAAEVGDVKIFNLMYHNYKFVIEDLILALGRAGTGGNPDIIKTLLTDDLILSIRDQPDTLATLSTSYRNYVERGFGDRDTVLLYVRSMPPGRSRMNLQWAFEAKNKKVMEILFQLPNFGPNVITHVIGNYFRDFDDDLLFGDDRGPVDTILELRHLEPVAKAFEQIRIVEMPDPEPVGIANPNEMVYRLEVIGNENN